MKGTIEERLLKALANRTRSVSTDVLANKIKAEKSSTASQLSKMTKSGIVTRTGPGKWKLSGISSVNDTPDVASNDTPDVAASVSSDSSALVTITLSRADTVMITSVLEGILKTLQKATEGVQEVPRKGPELRVVG